MKPGKPKAESKRMGWLGPLRGPVERFLSGGGNQDPLYLSKRTMGQRLLHFAKVGVPLLVVAGIALYIFARSRKADQAPEVLSPAEIAAKMLPNLSQPIHVDTNNDIAVLQVSLNHDSGDKVVGELQNTTDHEIENGDVDFTLTAASGTQLGTINVKVKKLPAGAKVAFSEPITQREAVFAQVREVRTR